MTADWFAPDEVVELVVVVVVLETVLEVAALLLVRLLDVSELLLVTVLEVPAPPPTMKYPPTPATTKTTTITTAAKVVEIPVDELRTASRPPATGTHLLRFSLNDT